MKDIILIVISFPLLIYLTYQIRWNIIEPYKKRKNGKSLIKKLKSMDIADAKILKDCYLPLNPGTTTKADIILIFQQGICVIKSENRENDIRGRNDEKCWTQTVSKGYKPLVHSFHNPVWDNNSNILALNNLLKRPDIPVYSLVVFPDECNLNVPSVCGKARVIQLKELNKIIRRVCDEKTNVLDAKEIKDLYDKILPCTKDSLTQQQEHIESINRMHKKKKHANIILPF